MGLRAIAKSDEVQAVYEANSQIARSVEVKKTRHIIHCDALIDLLSVNFEIPSREIRARNRGAESIARVRQIGMYVAHVVLRINMTDIGEGFGRDKSTVVHACHTIEDMRDDRDFDRIVAHFEALTRAAFKFSIDH